MRLREITARFDLDYRIKGNRENRHWVINAAHNERLYLANSLKAAAVRECKFILRV